MDDKVVLDLYSVALAAWPGVPNFPFGVGVAPKLWRERVRLRGEYDKGNSH